MKPIKDFPNYVVYDNGRIVNTNTNHTKKPTLTKNGYHSVDLYCNGRELRLYVHRIVAEAFLPNPNNLPCVNHKDTNKTNNKVDNLEWCTYTENMQHASANGLLRQSNITEDMVDGWILRYFSGETITDIAQTEDYALSTISIKIKDRVVDTGRLEEYQAKMHEHKVSIGMASKRLRKKVSQFALDRTYVATYNSLKDAQRATGIPSGNITNCTVGRSKTAGGFIWKSV